MAAEMHPVLSDSVPPAEQGEATAAEPREGNSEARKRSMHLRMSVAVELPGKHVLRPRLEGVMVQQGHAYYKL